VSRINSRTKGKQGELEACHKLKELFGFRCRRTQQFSGWAKGGDSPDIVCEETPGLFLEVKREENLSISRALLTAVKQAGRKCPVILHRRNRSAVGWMLTIRMSDLSRLAHAYHIATATKTEEDCAFSAAALPAEAEGQSASSREA
jgi:hypothetical protein